mmetsp:Transcript_15322/g.29704  ORF Transcript_15322/g.29704 Transcript_15322/m.29704 type:complete len:240 (-) Transcript_15322:174-893(-)
MGLPMRVLVVVFQKGGIGDPGRHAVAHALRQDDVNVRVVARDPDMLSEILNEDLLHSPRLTKFQADPANDTSSLKESMRGAEAVVSTLGNRQIGFERFGAQGTANVIQAMQENKVKRLVCISSVGINEDWPPMKWNWKICFAFSTMLMTVLRSAYQDLSRLELNVRQAEDIDYLIVRPCGLDPGEVPIGSWKLRTSDSDGSPLAEQVAKADVGQFMVQEALLPTLHNTAITIGQPLQEQ